MVLGCVAISTFCNKPPMNSPFIERGMKEEGKSIKDGTTCAMGMRYVVPILEM